jgi:hypothetical protein
MKRLLAAVVATFIALAALAPAVLAASPDLPHTGRVLISTQGDVAIPAGEHVDAVIVVGAAARIAGEVNTVVVIDGSAELQAGATAESIVAVRSPVELAAGSKVLGDVRTLDSLVHKNGDAAVGGEVRDLWGDVATLGWVLAPMMLLFYVGFALAGVVGGLVLAALASKQVRGAGELIAHETVSVLVAGVVGIVLPIVVIVALLASIVGIPLAIALLLAVWPAVAILGYLVAGIWLGDLIVSRATPHVHRERPYLAAIVGLVLLHLLGLWPPITMVASFLGYGAVLLFAWRVFRGRGAARVVAQPLTPVAMPR